jgi:hypothetical protein
MKRTSTIFSVMVVISIAGGATANGQTRDRNHDGDRRRSTSEHQARNTDRNNDYHNDHNNGQGHHDNRNDHGNRNDHHDSRDHHNRDNHHNYERRDVRHVYHYHDRYCNHQPVVIHHYARPRYIYYRDYDLYYDRINSVYISYSGRGWSITSALPVVLHSVNLRNTKRFEVNYYEDDFPRYLETRRPSYGRECEDW